VTAWFTGRGDGGKTILPSAGETWKDDPLLEALADLDELNAAIGLASSIYQELSEELSKVQAHIFEISSEIADFPQGFNDEKVSEIERLLNKYSSGLPVLRNFVLPSGHLGATALHLARAICRRAERRTVSLLKLGRCSPLHVKYLNRLSSLLFVLALWINYQRGIEERVWRGRK